VTTDLDASNGIILNSATWTNTADTTSKPSSLIYLTDDETNFQNAHAQVNGVCKIANDPFCGMQYAHWPGAVIPDPDRNRVIISYGKLCRASSGSQCTGTTGLGWGFYQAAIGYGLGARLTPSTGGFTDATGMKDSALFGLEGTTAYNRGAMVYNGYAYLYGGDNILVGGMVAKVSPSPFIMTGSSTENSFRCP
jgi:hypothetical protein